MSNNWFYPDNLKIELYRSGWRGDRSFNRVVADIGGGVFAPISHDEKDFVIKANTLNKVRGRDIDALIIPSKDGGRAITADTELDGIRLSHSESVVAGVSLFDSWEKAPIASENWYQLPSEIQIPAGLILVKACRPTKAGAYHFTLGPAEKMTLRHFVVLLTPLANDGRISKIR